jgi:3-oxoacyl-[acyl-carrier protein] reductase
VNPSSGSTYQDRVVVVTGARKGLGRLVADHFLEQGAEVVGLSRGEATIDHPNYEHHSVDVGDDRRVREVFLRIGRAHGSVDIVINNAAVVVVRHALITTASQAEEMLHTNVLGCLYVSREAAKLMRRQSWGRIINIGSIASLLAPVGEAVYAASKSASLTLTAVLAKEFAGYGITVNTVAVTALETDMLEQLPEHTVRTLVGSLTIPRKAAPDDVFNVIDFYASPRSSYITAQTLFLGGVN